MKPNSHFIDAKQVYKKFPLPGGRELAAVDDVTLSIAQGSLMVLSGVSGSGKSTLLGLLATLARPTSGEIYLDGHELRTCSEMQIDHS